MHVITKAGIIK